MDKLLGETFAIMRFASPDHSKGDRMKVIRPARLTRSTGLLATMGASPCGGSTSHDFFERRCKVL